jgi:dihydroneopterin aldolase
MLDKLIIAGLEFHGHCGITDEEQKTGQRFSVDVEIGYDIQSAARNDSLKDAIDYAAVSRRLVEVGRNEPFRLVEAMAERMAGVLLKEFGAREVRLRVKKLHPPVEAIKDYAAIEIHRTA